MAKKATVERATITFIHYETKEERVVNVPDKLQQISQAYISAFMTSEEHYEDLPWYREVRDAAIKEVEATHSNLHSADLLMKAFPKVRIAFAKKYLPELAPKEKKAKEPKPAKLNMWEI